MADNRSRDDLRAWLRRGDPAGAELPADDVRRMRQRILATAPAPPRLRIVPLAALAAAALVAVVLLRPAPPAAPPERTTSARTAPAPRQIQFTTDRGTQIVWTLDPGFEL